VATKVGWNGYATRWAALHGGYDPRSAGAVVGGWLRVAYGIGCVLARLRVSPTAVTAFGVLLCVAVPFAARRGGYGLLAGALLVVLAAVADSVDGAVAVIAGRVTRLGYVYDSVADRLGEAAWLVAFWVAGVPVPLVLAAGGLSWLHEYVRARAVSAGMKEIGVVTVGERPTRVSITVIGLLLGGAAGFVQPDLAPGTMTVLLAVWALLALFGLFQLLGAVRRTLA
jgi:CDP-diacylglycerol--glycerol-3-phosphate 3-phosphatidyltransferase